MSKIRPYIFLSGLVLIVSACSRKHEGKTIQFLTGDDAKYWTEVKQYPIKKYAGLKFNVGGRCDKYVLSIRTVVESK